MNRIDLLNQIYAGRTHLEAYLERISPDQMTQPDLPGDWSVKDLLAHIGWWEQRAVEIYYELVAGREPSYPVGEADVDTVNARVLDQYRPRGMDEIRDFEQNAYRSLLDVVETAPEADLFDPQRFAWTGGQPFANWINWNSFGHYEEHLQSLKTQMTSQPPAQDVLHKAGAFLEREGRDIDRALYDFLRNRNDAAQVLDVLAGFQLEDGGFTRLEVDIAAPVSNPFATELALRVMTWIDPPRDHPVVLRAVSYLEQTQDEEGCWRFVPEVYQHPLAPWFQGWQWPNLNPSGQIAGALKRLGLGSHRLHARVQTLFERLSQPIDLVNGAFYTVLPYAMYYQTEWDFPLADQYRYGVVWWLVRQHLTNKDLDATHFMELAPLPDLAIAARLPEAILSAKRNQLLDEQTDDGGWPTPYDLRWRSWTTVNNLLVLHAYGML